MKTRAAERTALEHQRDAAKARDEADRASCHGGGGAQRRRPPPLPASAANGGPFAPGGGPVVWWGAGPGGGSPEIQREDTSSVVSMVSV